MHSIVRCIDLRTYTVAGLSEEHPYLITIVPVDPEDIRDAWEFRCDTVQEMIEWANILCSFSIDDANTDVIASIDSVSSD